MWSQRFASDSLEIKLMADANSAYTLADIDHLRRLDEFDLMMIEQPSRTTTSSTTRSCRRRCYADLSGRVHPDGTACGQAIESAPARS